MCGMKQRFKLWLTVAILTIICGAIVMACLNSNDDHQHWKEDHPTVLME